MSGSYTESATNRDLGMSLWEMKQFVVSAEAAGIFPSARLKGLTGINGKLKEVTASNETNARRESLR